MKWLRWLLFLPEGASSFADSVDLLHAAVIGITMLLAFGLAGLALLYVVRYGRKPGVLTTQPLRVTRRAETAIIGATLTAFLALWVVGFRQYIHLETPPANALEIRVTAKQWMWKFAYPDGRRSASVLTVPAGQPIKLVMTSRDVIHSFYVPAFRIKQDVLPGRYVSAWFEAVQPGSYDVYCAEYCGLSHSNMLGTVRVLAPEAYARWIGGPVAADPDDEGDPVAWGEKLSVQKQCRTCHSIDGSNGVGPSWRGLYRSEVPLLGGRRLRADGEYLTRSMMDPKADIHEGYQPVMPTYRGVLSAAEAEALVAYIESLAGAATP